MAYLRKYDIAQEPKIFTYIYFKDQCNLDETLGNETNYGRLISICKTCNQKKIN